MDPRNYFDGDLAEILNGFTFARKMSIMFLDLTNVARELCKHDPYFDPLFLKILSLEKEWKHFGEKFAMLQEHYDQLSVALRDEKKRYSQYVSKMIEQKSSRSNSRHTKRHVFKTIRTQTSESLLKNVAALQEANDTLESIRKLVQTNNNNNNNIVATDQHRFQTKDFLYLWNTIEDLKERNLALVKCLEENVEQSVHIDYDKYIWKEDLTSETDEKVCAKTVSKF